jgi:hypothetical protein
LIRAAGLPVAGMVVAGSLWLAWHAQDSEARPNNAPAALQPAGTPAHDGHSDVASGDTSTSPMGESSAHTHGTETDVTPQQLSAAASFVADVRADTAKYSDVRAAMADGYVQITQDLPGIAAHFVKPAYLADGVMMHPAKPEFLLYTKRLDGNWRLVGVMFYGPPGTQPAPSYFGPLDAWHLHDNLCFTAAGVSIASGQAACSGLFVKQTNWQLHVWTVDDANGVFAHDYQKIAPGAFPGATRRADQEFAVKAQ